MSEFKHCFKRYELKYLITDEQRARIEHAMAVYVDPDEYGESTVISLYYDTPDYRLIRRSIENPVYKEKLRLRSYGTASPEDRVFLELKKKYDKVVYKRRIALKECEAEHYMAGECGLPVSSQIGNEIEYFRTYYGLLEPRMAISCDRTAYFSKEDADLRLTFDRNILWRDEDLTLSVSAQGQPLLVPGTSLMELKTAYALPLWLSHLLCENALYRTGFSKYGLAYKAKITSKEKGGIRCA